MNPNFVARNRNTVSPKSEFFSPKASRSTFQQLFLVWLRILFDGLLVVTSNAAEVVSV